MSLQNISIEIGKILKIPMYESLSESEKRTCNISDYYVINFSEYKGFSLMNVIRKKSFKDSNKTKSIYTLNLDTHKPTKKFSNTKKITSRSY